MAPEQHIGSELDLPPGLRVALVHDWLNGMRGGERVLEHFCHLFPKADLFTLLYDPARMSPTIRAMNVIESSFAKLPGARKNYRYYLALMPHFVGRFPTAGYDLVISTSHCVAKGAPPPERGVHLSYVFSPMRYVWDHFEDYLSGTWWKDAGLRFVRGPMQRWDVRSCDGVNSFAADSAHIASKIRRFWDRQARPILPPVDLETFTPSKRKPGGHFLVVSALVPYKKIDRAIEAAGIAGVPLIVVGDGPERERLEASAPSNVEFVGRVPDDHDLAEYYRDARALLYPGIEDFGITALEAQACGRPVLGLRGGGLMETVEEGVTGEFFDEPSAESLASVLANHSDDAYDSAAIRSHAEFFSEAHFRAELVDWINEETKLAFAGRGS